MTKQELLDCEISFEPVVEAMPDNTPESATTTGSNETEQTPKDGAAKEPETGAGNEMNGDPKPGEGAPEEQVNSNDEIEEKKQIEPQTNGKITDNIQPGVDTAFQESTAAVEAVGTELVVEANIDERFATTLSEIAALKAEQDKIKVALSQILTRIELVQEVTDKVVSPIDHDSLLTQAVGLLV